MKVYEYIPLYGLLFNFEYQTGIDGEKMTVNEMFDNYPDFELTDFHIDQLYYFDLASLQKVLEGNYFTPETVVSYLRELFDNYRQSGGNPFDWLQGTFESINLNPQNYKAELRATLEKTLLEWIEIFNKLPIDYLYYNTNPEALPPQQTETKTDKLKAELGKYGFFELQKVKQLSEPNKQSLVELISTNDLPYSIAMVEYLGFIKHLKAEHFTTDYKLFKAVANWFEVDERAVKGNIYVLNEFSKENRTRYTADQQKQIVQKNYEALK